MLTVSEGEMFVSGDHPIFNLFGSVPDQPETFAVLQFSERVETLNENSFLATSCGVTIIRFRDNFSYSLNPSFLPSENLKGSDAGTMERTEIPAE